MKDSSAKKYLITYAEAGATAAQAERILGLATQTMVSDGEGVARTLAEDSESPIHLEALGISIVTMNPEDASGLAVNPDIRSIEEDQEAYIQGFPVQPETEEAPSNILWNMVNIKAPAAWARGFNGTGVNVAVLDTGIATHPDLRIAGGVSFVPGEPGYQDENGHGTHCAGIIAGRGELAPNGYKVFGVASDCSLYAVKVLARSGGGMFSWILSGMEWCVANMIRVASMSLGSPSVPSVAWETAVKTCQERGVLVVCAAGNSFQGPFPWVNAPANSFTSGQPLESPVAVAAVDRSNNIAPFSSRGGQTADWNPVWVSAPGVAIYSTYLQNGYNTLSGTSMACPHVSGLAALIIQANPAGITPSLIGERLRATAAPLHSPPYPNTAYGYGLIDCEKANL